LKIFGKGRSKKFKRDHQDRLKIFDRERVIGLILVRVEPGKMINEI